MPESPQFYFRHIHPNRWRKNREGKFRLTSDIFTDGDNAVSLCSASETTPHKVMDDYPHQSVGLAVISAKDIYEANATVVIDNLGYEGHATLSYSETDDAKEVGNLATVLRDAASARGLLLFCYESPMRVFPPCEEGEGEPFDSDLEYSENLSDKNLI